MSSKEKTEITLPNSFTSRSAKIEDLKGVLNLLDTNSIALIGASDITEHELRTFWTSPKFNIENSTRVVCTGSGKIVGYSDIEDTTSVPVHPLISGCVHPDFEGQGIGMYLLHWATTRAHQAIERVPSDARVAVRTYALSTDIKSKQLYENKGFQIIRHFLRMEIEMDGAPPEAQLPEGIKVITQESFSDLRPVFDAYDESFQDHWGHVARPFDEKFEEWKDSIENNEKHDPSLCFLAMAGDEITAVCLCSPNVDDDRNMGWVNILGVRPKWRRKGLGLALLHHAFQQFYLREKFKVGLGVDANNLTNATQLYEKVGMRKSRQYDTYERELRAGKDLSRGN